MTGEGNGIDRQRPKVVMAAYVCRPGYGSESGAGWTMASAAARRNEVWLITQPFEREYIMRELEADPELARWLHPVYVSVDPRLDSRVTERLHFYWHYPLWQQKAKARARYLHRFVVFDVAHHTTFASDWQPTGLSRLGAVPLVWGPVGGSTRMPLRTALRWLPARAIPEELLRLVVTKTCRRAFGDRVARGAAVVVGLNKDTADRFGYMPNVHVASNAVVDIEGSAAGNAPEPLTRDDGLRHAVFAGRLVAYKGIELGVRALAQRGGAGWSYTLIGDGPRVERLRELAIRLHVDDRVHFIGRLPHEDVLAALTVADAYLAPAWHESAGWSVAEAISLGCPTVCLDIGGPAWISRDHGIAVPPLGNIPKKLAGALDRCPPRREPRAIFTMDRCADACDRWYSEAMALPGGRGGAMR